MAACVDDFQVRDDLQFTDPPRRQFGACADCEAGRCVPPARRGRRPLHRAARRHRRRRLVLPAWAREGVDVGPKSFAGLVSADRSSAPAASSTRR
jgi:hypothetical protein